MAKFVLLDGGAILRGEYSMLSNQQRKSSFKKDMPREKAHPLFLIGIKSLIEWGPRISELFEIGSSLSQGIGASTHEFNRINLALLTDLSCHRHHPVCTLPCPS
jgi:hypothetical protein